MTSMTKMTSKLTAAGTVPDFHRIPYYPLQPDGGKGTVAGANVKRIFERFEVV